jgi:dTMP kinase
MTSLARFITFEGIDGAGKSSHIEAVAALLRAAHFDCLCTREPGGTPLAEQLRTLFLHQPMDALTEALLVFAGRRDHLNTVIAPALAQGSAVLCDRFTDATFAYQGAGRGFDHAVLSQLEQWVQEGREPDLTLWFDLPPAVAAQRRGAARDPDRLEREAEAFFHRVRAGYEARARQAPDRVVRIDAAASMEAVRAQVLGVVSQRVLGLPSQQPAGAAPA